MGMPGHIQNIVKEAWKHGSVAVLLLSACSLLLTGCGERQNEEYEPTVTALEVNEDGTLTETILDVLDESWYSGTELESMIIDSIETFTSQSGSGSVTADSISIEDSSVHVQLTYASADDYAAYNHITFYAGSVLGAQLEEFMFESSFYKVNKGTMGTDLLERDEPLSHKEYQVLIGEATHEYHVPGNIVYVSSNAVCKDSYTVQANSEDIVIVQEDNSVAAAVDDNSLIYIFYEF